MTTAQSPPLEAPVLALAKASEADYGRFAARARRNEFWWYFNGPARYRGFSRPFADGDGRWWYRVKPGFAWAVDFFRPFPRDYRSPGKAGLLGWQFPVDGAASNSTVSMNVIHDLTGYGMDRVAENKRRAIRKGLRQLQAAVLDPRDSEVCGEACEVWNSHVARTGWNKGFSAAAFQETWAELADWPGTTVLGVRARSGDSRLCAWLIARVIDETVFVDTLASHSDRLADRPNDTIVFTGLSSAMRCGVRHAHYSLKSDIVSLEEFKTSLGFTVHAFPAKLHVRTPVRWALGLLFPKTYQRLQGG